MTRLLAAGAGGWGRGARLRPRLPLQAVNLVLRHGVAPADLLALHVACRDELAQAFGGEADLASVAVLNRTNVSSPMRQIPPATSLAYHKVSGHAPSNG